MEKEIHWHEYIPKKEWTPERIQHEVVNMLTSLRRPIEATEPILYDPSRYSPWGWIGWREKDVPIRIHKNEP